MSFKETVHGPVSGTVTVQGKPYAIANLRSSRGRETTSGFIGSALNSGPRSPKEFLSGTRGFGFTFNLFYVDHKNIAFISTGRLPIRAPGTNPSLPTLGTGQYDWRGFLKQSQHPQVDQPEERRDQELERQPGQGLRILRQQLVEPVGRPQQTCSPASSAATGSSTC